MTQSALPQRPADGSLTRHGSPAETEPPQAAPSDSTEDPHSPGPQPLDFLIGSLIGLLTAIVPLATVMAGRPTPPGPALFYGSQPTAGIPSTRAGEPGGGDPGRQP
ncbi:conserved protein of unknown function [Cyanobium sp. NIES-981]|nr:conserved protein of unknown function [Cyanobium sp. NIES-981]